MQLLWRAGGFLQEKYVILCLKKTLSRHDGQGCNKAVARRLWGGRHGADVCGRLLLCSLEAASRQRRHSVTAKAALCHCQMRHFATAKAALCLWRRGSFRRLKCHLARASHASWADGEWQQRQQSRVTVVACPCRKVKIITHQPRNKSHGPHIYEHQHTVGSREP